MTTRKIPFGSAVRLKAGGPRMLAMGYCKRSGEVLCEWLDEGGVPNVWGYPAGVLDILALPLRQLPWQTR